MRLTSTVRHSRMAPLALTGVLLLSACASKADAGATTPSATEDAPAATASAEPTPTETIEPAVDVTAGAECLKGQWTTDVEAAKAAALAAFAQDPTITPTVDLTGDGWTTFDGATMTEVYQQQTVTVSAESEGQAFVMTITLDGTLTGPYTATDTAVTVSAVDTSAMTMTMTATLNGEPLELPPTTDLSSVGADAGGTSTYTCAGPTLTMTATDTGAAAVTQTLTRR
ncbi:MAG TPA: hypothetical protein VGK17_08845 [Propionicimonas sp.]|jgi:hypothetical protein